MERKRWAEAADLKRCIFRSRRSVQAKLGFAEWREFEELEGTAPVPAQGPAWAHRCAPRRFGSTDLSIGPGQGDAAEPGTSTLILC
jgi:hypothetical protein